MTSKEKTNLIRAAVYSANVTITPAQAIALIAPLFEPTEWRLNPEALPLLMAMVSPQPKLSSRRRRRAR